MEVSESLATFTLVRFHLDPFLLVKPELIFFPVHTAPFTYKNGYLSTSVHACSQERTWLSLLDYKTRKACYC